MRNFTKRTLSLIMAFVLAVGLLSGIGLNASAATVNYKYGTDSKYGQVIKNWGKRGEVATFLSPNAEAFYADNNVTYSALSQLSGSSDTYVYTSELYKRLNSLLTSTKTAETTYDDTKTLYQFTDCEENGNTISCFYSGAAIGPEWDGGSTWNREHTWPNSKGDDNGNGENDIMMLRPTSSSINSGRGNNAYGEGGSYYDPNSASNGTYDLRGDVARILLYVYTRWPSNHTTDYMWGTEGVIESKEVLLKWMKEDPVDTWEMGRNDSAQSIIGTRNVYVDYPELAFLLFNEAVPEDMTTPSGSGNAEVTPPSYTVTAVSGNASYGTVSLSGNTITATPAENCYVSGYTVTSGQATVVRSGNTFTVTAITDCTVRINFAVNPTGSDDSVQILSNNVYYGETLNLMYAIYAEDAGSYTTKVTLYTDAACENKLCDAVALKDENGDTVTVNKNGKTCVAYVSEVGVALHNLDTVVYAKAQLMNGANVVASSKVQRYSVLEYLHERMMSGVSDAYVTMYKNLITYAASAQTVFGSGTDSVNNYSYVRVENGTLDGVYNAGMLTAGTGLESVSTNLEAGDGYKVEWTVQEYNHATVTGTKALTTDEVKELQVEAGVNLHLVANVVEDTSNLPDKVVTFTMGDDGDATHSDGSSDTAQYSETVDGYTMTLTGGSKMYPKSRDAAGNGCIKLGTGDTAGTFTLTVASDVSKVIISVAGYKGNAAKISINGGEVQIISTLSNNGAYTDIEIDTSDNKTITFTTASGGYRAMINTIKFAVPDRSNPDDTTPDETVPDETVPDETVPDETVPDETVPEETEPVAKKKVWQLVTDVSELSDNDQIILVNTANGKAMSTTQNTNNRGATAITLTTEIAEGDISSSVQIIVLKKGSTYWEFMVDGKYLYCASTSSKNYLRTQETNTVSGQWTITISNNGVATIKSMTNMARNLLQYNKSSDIFACYSSSQQDVAIYKLVEVDVK